MTTYSPGQVLSASDLNASFAAKATYSYGTAVPVAPEAGQIWMDTTAGTAIPTAKVYTGSGWVSFSNARGPLVSGTTGSPATSNFTSGGVTYDVYQWTSAGSGSITFSSAGYIKYLVEGGGGGGDSLGAGWGGGGAGGCKEAWFYVSAGTYNITVGGGGAGGVTSGSRGSSSELTGVVTCGGGGGGHTYAVDNGGGGGGGNSQDGGKNTISSSITGATFTYGENGGAQNGGNGGGGRVIIQIAR